MHPRFSNLVLTTAALIALAAAPATGGPLGGTVVGGSATIQGQGGPSVIVNQSSNAAIINWNTFNIGVNESVRFNQPSSSSVVLNRFTLDLYGDKLITLAVSDHIASKVVDVATGRPLKSLVTNEGKIRANGGRVELSAAAARGVVDSVINTSGVIKANSIGRRNGMIVLSATTGASKPADAATQTIKISGTLSAAGKKKGTQGGTILVSGEDIKLTNARVDASGRVGGGKVLIGGDWGGGKPNKSFVNNPSAKLESFAIPTATTVSVDAGTTINASATKRGNGGKVVLWSDSETTFAGTILAKGGTKGGDGGFVETSSHGVLNYTGTTDTRAPKGAAGTLLLDPADFYIQNSMPPTGASWMTPQQVEGVLATSNLVIATNNSSNPPGQNGDIFVNDSI